MWLNNKFIVLTLLGLVALASAQDETEVVVPPTPEDQQNVDDQDSGASDQEVIPVPDTSGQDGGEDAIDTSGDGGDSGEAAVSGEEAFAALSQLGISLLGTGSPNGAANQIIPALEGLRGADIGSIGEIASSGSGSENISQYFNDTLDADSRLFAATDQQLASLIKEQVDHQCYMIFQTSISEIYIGWLRLQDLALGRESDNNKTFDDFCIEQTQLDQYVENLRSYLMGDGDCDVLQTLYDGDVEKSIYSGWRDNMADKVGYLVMYLAEGYAIQQACGGSSEQNNASSDDNSTDGDKLESVSAELDAVIDRVQQFDRQARTQVQATVSQNLNQLLKLGEGLTLDIMADNIVLWSLPGLYPDYLWQMGAVYSNGSADDFYSDCWSCLTVIQGEFQVTVAWISANSTASQSEGALDQYSDAEGDNQELASQIWEALGQCVSGVWIFNSEVPHYVVSGFEDRLLVSQGQNKDIYAWGVQEQCFGQPLGLY